MKQYQGLDGHGKQTSNQHNKQTIYYTIKLPLGDCRTGMRNFSERSTLIQKDTHTSNKLSLENGCCLYSMPCILNLALIRKVEAF